jgi:regulator of extracellular matrix RemA (YlzA/DUF370 family)
MKTIQLVNSGSIRAAEVIAAAVSTSTQGIRVDEIRRRVRILDAVDGKTEGPVELEDADHQKLVEIINSYPFAIASRDLLAVIDGIVQGA